MFGGVGQLGEDRVVLYSVVDSLYAFTVAACEIAS
jgi:hypothetical protein